MKRIIFLAGATAVGKTAVAVRLGKMLKAEIVSCDSMQVYKGMDIGTQKPTKAQRKMVKHHMIGIVPPSKSFSVADFRKRALKCIKDIENRGKNVLFAGGTALYIKALTDGLFPSPPTDYPLRKKLMEQENKNCSGYLHEKLNRVDAETARLLHPNDTRRVIRALEIYISTKTPMSELKKATRGLKEKYEIKIFCINRDRQALYRIIDKRVDNMFRKGFAAECRRLKNKRLSMTAQHALGYREVFDSLDKRISINDVKESIKKQTRNFAKRQLSWFRNDSRIEWISIDGYTPKQAADIICKKLMK
jgi:tRNA dimethylallyltransferase